MRVPARWRDLRVGVACRTTASVVTTPGRPISGKPVVPSTANEYANACIGWRGLCVPCMALDNEMYELAHVLGPRRNEA